jgi:hypothetical protein
MIMRRDCSLSIRLGMNAFMTVVFQRHFIKIITVKRDFATSNAGGFWLFF